MRRTHACMTARHAQSGRDSSPLNKTGEIHWLTQGRHCRLVMEAKHQCRQGLGRFTSMPWFDAAENDTAGDEFKKKKLELELKLRAASALIGSS